ncbi:MAG: FG-GAP-like repeat-containing protein [Bacteroidota bacterium]
MGTVRNSRFKHGKMNRPLPLKLYYFCFLSLILSGNTGQAQIFREVGKQLGINAYALDKAIMGGGVAFFDYDQDLYPDILILGGENKNSLYRNNWDGSFSNVSKLAGIELSGKTTYGIAVGDIDNDGDEDIFISTGPGEANVLLENKGDGTFHDISIQAGITDISWSTSVSMGDINLDGLLDIYVMNYAEFENYPFASNLDKCSPNFLYQNLGNNQFVEVAEELGLADIGCGLAVAFTDCDNDHDVDLHLANDFGGRFEPNELYYNTFPLEEFQRAKPSSNLQVAINGMGVAIGDYDEDGDLDYYLTNMGENPFFENQGNGTFSDIAFQKGVSNPDGTSWGAAFLDFNQDTYLDLIVANGQVVEDNHQNHENRLFSGNAAHNFSDISKEASLDNPAKCRGFSMADIDQDGDLDLLFGMVSDSEDPNARSLIYLNEQDNIGNWLKIKLQGRDAHRNAYGSHIQAFIGDRILMREVDGGSSYLSHSSSELHFGLGNIQSIDSLVVSWPGGHRDVFKNISVNQQLLLFEKGGLYPYRHQELSLTKGDSIFLANAFQKEAGIYREVTKNREGVDSILLITQLKLEEPHLPMGPEVEFSIGPNPFNGSTVLTYTLAQAGEVDLTVFDLRGKRILSLSKSYQDAGEHSFVLEDISLGKGLYLFQLKIGEHIHMVKAMKLD